MNLKTKTENQSVEIIVQKMMQYKLQSKSQIYEKYVEVVPQDSRIVNYQLQERNLELRKELKKLEGILNNKLKVKKKIQNTQAEIMGIKEKLKSVLNMSQNLEFSLVKHRVLQSSQLSLTQNEEKECCCQKRRKSKRQKSKSNFQERVVNGEEEDQRKRQLEKLKTSTKNKNQLEPINPQMKSQSAQTQQNEIQQLQQRIKSKQAHAQKLKSLIQSQNSMIQNYESSLYTQSKAGKITKVSQLKQNSCIKTCASVGSIKGINKISK